MKTYVQFVSSPSRFNVAMTFACNETFNSSRKLQLAHTMNSNATSIQQMATKNYRISGKYPLVTIEKKGEVEDMSTIANGSYGL